jgi:hypothetical protein
MIPLNRLAADPPTQAEIEALSRELTEGKHVTDLHRRAALMIARLELAWRLAQTPQP